MSAIIINISNSKIPGLTTVKRSITISGHTKDYQNESFTVPYVLEHFDSNYFKISIIPDVYYTLLADNIKRIWVKPDGTTSGTYIPDGTEMGLYTYFVELQKTYTDVQILTQQIMTLDAEGFFDPVIGGGF